MLIQNYNDASSIMINSAIRSSNSANYISNYRLIDSLEGMTTNDLGLTIMRYFYLYDCTDLALDTNGRDAPYIGDGVCEVRKKTGTLRCEPEWKV